MCTVNIFLDSTLQMIEHISEGVCELVISIYTYIDKIHLHINLQAYVCVCECMCVYIYI